LCPAHRDLVRVLTSERVLLQHRYRLLIGLLETHGLIDLLCDDRRLIVVFEDELAVHCSCYHCLVGSFRRLTGIGPGWPDVFIRHALQHAFELEVLIVIEAIVGRQGSNPQAIIDAVYEVRPHAFSPSGVG
jgi:hypothetical protein